MKVKTHHLQTNNAICNFKKCLFSFGHLTSRLSNPQNFTFFRSKFAHYQLQYCFKTQKLGSVYPESACVTRQLLNIRSLIRSPLGLGGFSPPLMAYNELTISYKYNVHYIA